MKMVWGLLLSLFWAITANAQDASTIYRLVTACNNTYRMQSNGATAGAAITTGTNVPGYTQMFMFEQHTSGFVITNLHTNMVLDIAAKSKSANAVVVQAPFDNSLSQQFSLTLQTSGYYRIKNLNSNLFLQSNTTMPQVGSFKQVASSPVCSQQFKLVSANVPLPTDKIFAANSFWYTPIPANAPLASNSAALVADLVKQKTDFYGHVAVNTAQYSSPVYVVGANEPTQKVTQWDCQNKGYLDSSLKYQWAAVPVPSFALQSAGNDGEMTIYQPSTNMLFEFWKARKTATGTWEGCWGGRMVDVSTNPGIWQGNYGTTAVGLPFLGGQVTAEELQRGEIRHAIGIAVVKASKTTSWPARRNDGLGGSIISEGQRFRLDPSIDVESLPLSRAGKIIARAGQKYGFVVWDKAGAVSIRMQNVTSYYAYGATVSPYQVLFQGRATYDVLKNFPLDKVQFMPLNYGKPVVP